MKTVILDGSRSLESPLAIINSKVEAELNKRGWEIDNIQLCEEKIATCIGCFGCWLKTPGECVINDKAREIAKKIIQSDLIILLNPITFGGYSFELKKIMDRIIPLILPFFAKIDGEIHHQPRYEKYPNIIAIGYQSQEDARSEETFKKLIERNVINFHSHNYSVGTLTGDIESLGLKELLNSLIEEVV